MRSAHFDQGGPHRKIPKFNSLKIVHPDPIKCQRAGPSISSAFKQYTTFKSTKYTSSRGPPPLKIPHLQYKLYLLGLYKHVFYLLYLSCWYSHASLQTAIMHGASNHIRIVVRFHIKYHTDPEIEDGIRTAWLTPTFGGIGVHSLGIWNFSLQTWSSLLDKWVFSIA